MSRATKLFITFGVIGLIGIGFSALLNFVLASQFANHAQIPPDDWCGLTKHIVEIIWKRRAVALFKFSVVAIILDCILFGLHSHIVRHTIAS